MPVKTVPSVGWTRRSVAVSLLLSMDEHRKQSGLRVARLRGARQMSQEDLAQRAGLSVKTISRFEKGRHDGRRETVRKLAKGLEVSEDELLGPPPQPLGLGPTQLDRIEEKLDDLLRRLATEVEPPEADSAARPMSES